MRPIKDKLYEQIMECISGNPYSSAGSDFEPGDVLSEAYLACTDRSQKLGRQLTFEEVESLTRSIKIASGRPRAPMARFSGFDFEQIDSSMRSLVGLSESPEADSDTEFTELLLETFDSLNIESVLRKFNVHLPQESHE